MDGQPTTSNRSLQKYRPAKAKTFTVCKTLPEALNLLTVLGSKYIDMRVKEYADCAPRYIVNHYVTRRMK